MRLWVWLLLLAALGAACGGAMVLFKDRLPQHDHMVFYQMSRGSFGSVDYPPFAVVFGKLFSWDYGAFIFAWTFVVFSLAIALSIMQQPIKGVMLLATLGPWFMAFSGLYAQFVMVLLFGWLVFVLEARRRARARWVSVWFDVACIAILSALAHHWGAVLVLAVVVAYGLEFLRSYAKVALLWAFLAWCWLAYALFAHFGYSWWEAVFVWGMLPVFLMSGVQLAVKKHASALALLGLLFLVSSYEPRAVIFAAFYAVLLYEPVWSLAEMLAFLSMFLLEGGYFALQFLK